MLLSTYPGHQVRDGGSRQTAQETHDTWPVSAKVICGLLMPFDLLSLMAVGGIAYFIRFWETASGDPMGYAAIVVFGSLIAVNALYLAGQYKSETLRRRTSAMTRAVACWIAVAAILTSVGFLTKTSEEYSRLWSLMWFGLGVTVLISGRLFLFARASRWMSEGRLSNSIAIVGDGELAAQTASRFLDHGDDGIRCAGIFTDRGAVAYGIDGDLDDLIQGIRHEQIDTVVIAIDEPEDDRIHRILETLAEAPVDVRICPGPLAVRFAGREVSCYAGLPALNAVDRPLADWHYTLKSVEDRVLGAIITLMISPVMLLIAALIKLDSPGPALFRQKRFGFNNELVEVYKFRTMYVENTDTRGDRLTERNDPRITRIGQFLRSTSLDELPQFFNVLRGDMSIVGPRPHAVASKAAGRLYQDAVPHYDARHRVKPGITGWAQINGWRGPTETIRQIRKRVEHDLYYIDNWSIWLDLKIILLTVFKGFVSRNAF